MVDGMALESAYAKTVAPWWGVSHEAILPLGPVGNHSAWLFLQKTSRQVVKNMTLTTDLHEVGWIDLFWSWQFFFENL